MLRESLIAIAACAATFGVASAQSLNIDIGVFFPAPASSFGAAASQPGAWNSVDPGLTSATALFDLAGSPTVATIQRTAGSGSEVSWNNPGTTGDDGALMDDGDDPGSGAIWKIRGLAAGDYVVTSYAWSSLDPAARTNVSVAPAGGGAVVVGGSPWPGGYALGVTHAVHAVTLSPGADLDIVVSAVDPIGSFGTFNGVQLRKLTPSSTVTCPGDGSAAPCPCGNSGSAGNGCANSTFAAGARLAASGTFSVSADTGVLLANNLTGTGAFFYQGDTLAPPFAIDDGLACVGGVIIRIPGRAIVGNSSQYPSLGDVPLSVRGAIPPAGGTRHYQCFYRNAVAAFCPPATSNRTNGVQITWTP